PQLTGSWGLHIVRLTTQDNLVEAGFLFRWSLLLLLWSSRKGQNCERPGMALVTIVAADCAAILFHKPAREVSHHEPSDLLSRGLIVEIAGMAIGALNSQRLRKRIHYLDNAIARHVL